MAASPTLRKVGQILSSVFLNLTGSWLLVICVGGLLTLGALSLFHLGVLLSLGCIGLCLCVAGVGWLVSALSSNTTPQRSSSLLCEKDARKWPFEDDKDFFKQPKQQLIKQPFHRLRNEVHPEIDACEPLLRRKPSHPSLNQ